MDIEMHNSIFRCFLPLRQRRKNKFPNELWEIIFKKIDDPFILFELQFICHNWHNMIAPILLDSIRWRNACKKFIPYFWLGPKLDGSMHIELHDSNKIYHSKESRNAWRNIYLSWRKLQKETIQLTRSTSVTTNGILKFSKLERVTCIDVYGNDFSNYFIINFTV